MIALTQLLVQKLKIPVIAVGGIMSGGGVAQCLQSGAQAAQLGTAFLLCPEAGVSKPYREILQNPAHDKTALTQAFSGRWAREVSNRFMQEMSAQPEAIMPWPRQNFFTRDIRKKAAEMNRAEFLSLWAGTGLRQMRELPAAVLMKKIEEEFLKF